MTVFNTVEDVNGTQFDNQGFWWYELDTSKISSTSDFNNVKYDFCTVSRETGSFDGDTYKYTIYPTHSQWIRCVYDSDDYILNIYATHVIVYSNLPSVIVPFYMGNILPTIRGTMYGKLIYENIDVYYKDLNNVRRIPILFEGRSNSVSVNLQQGYNEIIYSQSYPYVTRTFCGFLLVNLLKTDFQFQCNQDLIVGEVNTVQLGTATDYKVGGDLVGEYETKLSVLYNNKTIPVVWNSQLNDYTFDLDLTNIQSEGKIRFKVIVEANEVLNHSETDVALYCKFETIDTLAKLIELFRIGGVGRLGTNLTLTDDLTVSKSVNLIGNDYSIDMSNCKIVVPSDLTFKAQSVGFSNGVNTLQQEPNSTVELNNCSFTDCTGFGSVIDCQVDLASLSDGDDFTTKLTNCNISNCDMAILHSGNLEVTGCTVTGKISNKNYPYFLYQTDGNATILNSQFNLSSDTEYDYDIEFNSCIFVCGETATVNGYSHSELQQGNISAFFNTQRNTSTIDVKYYYSLIEDTVHLKSNKGYCHSVSGVDYIFKSNVTITRGE